MTPAPVSAAARLRALHQEIFCLDSNEPMQTIVDALPALADALEVLQATVVVLGEPPEALHEDLMDLYDVSTMRALQTNGERALAAVSAQLGETE